jgi:hypothetical protein
VFAEDGSLADPKVQAGLTGFLQGFVQFVQSAARPHA